ncbi:hypothetical protein J6524_05325 [Bradyrhizobium sp. WSM 1738]|uniref:hypothetical protein n=1 Tax=Bradyrhizobium hereditatis TaxID=2821405 RepID=UPI001CE3041D|nr:hypothetical protein [Bradyrhizobium hereditatis]MCA6114350.1 hypothetical protein [Bradyrhizobium hereditatis]
MTTIVEEELAYSSPAPFLAWTPAVAGALIGAAFSTVLIAFGTAIGLGVASAAPSWRDASVALWLLSGFYLILVALISFGLGGYVAGRIPSNRPTTDSGGIELRDGLHGLAAWALAVVLTVLISTLIANAAASRASSAQNMPSAMAAEPLLSYELDRLFRPARRNPNAETGMERAETGRILLTSSSHSGVAAEDRTYLVQLVNGIAGLAGPDAERRVDNVIAASKTAIARSRRSAIIAAFSVAASILLGAVVAWLAACEGGRHRDGAAPEWLATRSLAPGRPSVR